MKLLKQILSLLPTKLPVGLTEFNRFADDVIELSGKFADRDSMRFAIASMIIHLDSKKGSVRKIQIVNMLRKSAANQVASQVFHDIKTQQAEAMAKQQQEDTAKVEANTSADQQRVSEA